MFDLNLVMKKQSDIYPAKQLGFISKEVRVRKKKKISLKENKEIPKQNVILVTRWGKKK